jgi:hypothetical protein
MKAQGFPILLKYYAVTNSLRHSRNDEDPYERTNNLLTTSPLVKIVKTDTIHKGPLPLRVLNQDAIISSKSICPMKTPQHRLGEARESRDTSSTRF